MPLDPSIPLSYRPTPLVSPLDSAQKVLTLAGLLQQQQARAMELEGEMALRRFLAASNGDLEKATQAALQTGNVAAAAKLVPLLKEHRTAQLLSQAGGGAGSDDPAFWERATLAGVPGAAQQVEKLKARQEARQQLGLMQGTTGVEGATSYAPTEAEATELAKQRMAAGEKVSIGVGEPPTGGFANLLQSQFPEIRAQARMLQNRLNATPQTAMNPATLKFYQDAQQKLAERETQMHQQLNLRTQVPQPVQVLYEPIGNGKYRAVDARTRQVLSEDALPPGAVISPALKAEAAAATEAGKAGTKNAEALYESATAANDVVNKTDLLINHIKTSKAITGLGADILKNVERLKVLLANRERAGLTVSDTELLDAMMGSEVFPMIKSLGIGARGLDTPAEREFLRQVMTGTITLNKDTLLRMAQLRKSLALREIEKYNERVDSGSLDDFFKFSRIPKRKFGREGAVQSVSEGAGTPAPPAGFKVD